MGLDMFLFKKTFMWSEDRKQINLTGVEKYHIIPSRINYIVEEIGYWRKANAIHKWFVDNIQDGVDDCGEYYVSQKELSELLDLVNKALDSKPEDKILLPTQSGFFFGSTEYDEWYLENLRNTKQILLEALKESESANFYYQSSW